MRFLIGVMIVLATLFALQSRHPECSMTGVTGVEWVKCLAKSELGDQRFGLLDNN